MLLNSFKLSYQVLAEFIGTALLLSIVVGSGYMGQSLSNGNDAIALLGNSIATGTGLFVLISLLSPISGAHFNPIVSLMFYFLGEYKFSKLLSYVIAQCIGAMLGVYLVHLMFNLPIIQYSQHHRDIAGMWVSEYTSSIILLSVILLSIRFAKDNVASMVAFIVTAGYWFTSSTFFSNPAVTIARAFTNTFAGIYIESVPMFILSQILACVTVSIIAKRIVKKSSQNHTIKL